MHWGSINLTEIAHGRAHVDKAEKPWSGLLFGIWSSTVSLLWLQLTKKLESLHDLQCFYSAAILLLSTAFSSNQEYSLTISWVFEKNFALIHVTDKWPVMPVRLWTSTPHHLSTQSKEWGHTAKGNFPECVLLLSRHTFERDGIDIHKSHLTILCVRVYICL